MLRPSEAIRSVIRRASWRRWEDTGSGQKAAREAGAVFPMVGREEWVETELVGKGGHSCDPRYHLGGQALPR